MGFKNWHDLDPQERAPGRSLRALTTERVTIARVEHDGPTDHEPHVHDDVEQIMVVLEGEVEFTVGDEKKVVRPGDFVYIPPGVPHGAKVARGMHTVNLEIFCPSRPELAAKEE